MARFDKTQIGDKVWDDRFGWGTVLDLVDYNRTMYISFYDKHRRYGLDGREESGSGLPSLHWDKPVYEEPPPPKRKKKVTLDRWFVVQSHKLLSGGYSVQAYFEEPERLDSEVHRWHQTIEFEVEE